MNYVIIDENNKSVNYIVVENPEEMELPPGHRLVVPVGNWLGEGSYYNEIDGTFYLENSEDS
jgi:hypothetical protein